MKELQTLFDALLKVTPENALQTSMSMFETIQHITDEKGAYELIAFLRSLELYYKPLYENKRGNEDTLIKIKIIAKAVVQQIEFVSHKHEYVRSLRAYVENSNCLDQLDWTR